jgi:hypothetical protein
MSTSRLHPVLRYAHLSGGAEARHHVYGYGVVGEPASEGVEVLHRQNRGGHQDGHLAAGHYGLEGGADGHLGLAESHVGRR